ncbi:MAG: DUF3857 domain-containing protein [Acidobacteriota bacterium]
MESRRFSILAASCLILAVTIPARAGEARPPYADAEAFSLPAAALAEAARAVAVPKDADAFVLLDATTCRFDDAGRRTVRRHRISRIVTGRASGGWLTVQGTFTAWYQDRVEIKARVIAADGQEIALDPSTIVDMAPESEGETKIVRAPLPGTGPGAVIETEVIVRDREPIFPAGSAGSVTFGDAAITRLVLEAPSSKPLKVASTLPAPAEPKREEAGGTLRLTYESGAIDPKGGTLPTVGFASGQSWSEIAKAYSDLVGASIEGSDVAAAAKAAAGLDARKAAAALLPALAAMRARNAPVGSSPLPPARPADVLERKYGDGKDLATLLVALLRAAGHKADVALVRSGFDADVSPDLPGLDVFRHAIVFVPPSLWIDPSSREASGTLPPECQGRLALVASAATRELVRTPEAGAGENKLVVTQELTLAELGPARMVETLEGTGAFGTMLRAAYGGLADAKVRPMLQRHIELSARAKTLDRYEVTGADDPAAPLRLRIESSECAIGFTNERRADAGISLTGLFEAMPDELRRERQEGDPPQGEVALDFPQQIECRMRVLPPPGYVIAALPADKSETFGPARFSVKWTKEKDGSVSGTALFDSGKRRYTAEEATEVQKGLSPLIHSEAATFKFDQIGQKALENDKVKDALLEFKKLADQHPSESYHRTQIALALLDAGLGDAAVVEARKAVEMEPSSALAHRRLAFVLAHDTLGRQLGRGFDIKAAEASYRKAIEVDPKDQWARNSLGYLLEFDERGNHYSESARLGDAVTEYQQNGSHEMDDRVAYCLFYDEKWDELARFAQGSDLHERDGLLAAAEAATKGASAGVTLARKTVPDAPHQRRALMTAAMTLWQLRRYPEASTLLRESAAGAEDEAGRRQFSEEIGRVKKVEDLALSPNDPTSVIKRLEIEICASTPDEARIAGLFSEAIPPAVVQKAVKKLVKAQSWPRSYDERFRKIILDAILSLSKFQVDGNEALGYRIRLHLEADLVEQEDMYFVVREKDGYKIAATWDTLPWMGLQALAHLDRRDTAGAKKWLDWTRENLQMFGPGDPLVGPAFTRLWQPGQLAGAEVARVAIGSLLAMDLEPQRALDTLLPARQEAKTDRDRVDLDLALADAYIALDRRPEAIEIYERLAKGAPSSFLGFLRLALLYDRYGMVDQMKTIAELRNRADPHDTLGIEVLAIAATAKGDFAGAQGYYAKLQTESKSKEHPLDDRETAWSALLAGSVTAEDEKRAKRAAEARTRLQTKTQALHTLAAIEAELGHVAEARDALFDCIELRGGDPASEDWYVHGRIAELLGETESAKKAYAQVEKPEETSEISGSSWTLAKRRLAALETARPAGPKKTGSKP